MSLSAVRLASAILRNAPKSRLINGCSNLNSSASKFLTREISTAQVSLSKKEWVEVTFETTDGAAYTVQGKEGDNLLDVVVNNNVDLDGFGACEGTLSCSTCHLIFKKEDFDKIEDPCTDEELDMLDLAYGLTDTSMCLSLAGCGFLGVYLVGALECLKRFSPHFMEKVKVYGLSAGALLGATLICDAPLDNARFNFLDTAAAAQDWVMGPFNPGFKFEEYLCKGLEGLPPDAHSRASGRLHVAVTRFPDMANVVISNWKTREDLIQTLRCSCFILGFSGMQPPMLNGERYIDGGYSSKKLNAFQGVAISISPFCGDADICPQEGQGVGKLRWSTQGMELSLTNAVRIYRTLLPPPPHVLNEYYQSGYLDAYNYLKDRKSGSVSL